MKPMFFFISLIFSFQAFSNPQCLKDKNPCDPDLLCTFKAEWHSKVFLYIATIMNDPARKGKKPKDGYYYDGNLYEQSMELARAQNPGANLETIKRAAGPIFEDKLRIFAYSTFELPECDLKGKYDKERSVPEGYEGMFTDKDCKVWVSYYGGQYDPKTFGKNGTACEELYTRDYAHEQIHVKACERFKKKGQIDHSFNIDILVKEEAAAYKHTMKLSEAHYRYLLAQCSDKIPNQEKTRKQFKNISDLLKGFETRGIQ